jgi:hypothetical protein
MSDESTSRSAPFFLQKLLPVDETARKISLWMLVPVGLAYIGRIIIYQWNAFERGPLGPLYWFICPAACVAAFVIGISVLWLAMFAMRRARHVAPAVLLIGGITLIPFLPLPPLPKPVFPEEEFFAAHREEFEHIILLAEREELSCFRLGCEYFARVLPEGYKYLSYDGYVSVHHIQSRGLVLEFRPTGFYYPVIYFEEPEDRNLQTFYTCHGDGSGHVRKIDEHWWVCIEEWN